MDLLAELDLLEEVVFFDADGFSAGGSLFTVDSLVAVFFVGDDSVDAVDSFASDVAVAFLDVVFLVAVFEVGDLACVVFLSEEVGLDTANRKS